MLEVGEEIKRLALGNATSIVDETIGYHLSLGTAISALSKMHL
jgi:hypothetical protein